ncbi:hypothetical protein [Paenibacillus sp. L3-i20]|uniref:hypothetical protein n=1 Tax=Paenibacillus sp. L3-i20 TaxID=2905833 RepID=UPI001EDD8E97|nr:hypothetical protein [Paenibacillus sp. L3-i20]GKU79814.1 hypothetical protein L3i20_v242110 [Paenibacillus sp. L3-i20]
MSLPFRPYSKEEQVRKVRTKPTQRQMGDISNKVDKHLKQRSGGLCEVRHLCKGAQATERAHTIGRRIIPHKTTVDDLFHACNACHLWLDREPAGIRFKRSVLEIGTTTYLKGLSR